TLKFIQGAISTKDFVPSLTHFHIKGGIIQGYNGVIALNSTIPLNINCSPNASNFIKAIDKCTEVVELKLMKSKLNIKSGSFKANINCLDDEFEHLQPEGTFVSIDGDKLLQAFRTLSPLMGFDASRLWTNGILLKNGGAFATNNVIAARYDIGAIFPFVINIPSIAIKEILRIKEIPVNLQITDRHVTFHYTEGRWLRSSLYVNEWPDLDALIGDSISDPEIGENFYTGLDSIQSFASDINSVYFKDGTMSTSLNPDESEATYDMQSINFEAVYNVKMLQLLKGIATSMDLSKYPNPGTFKGDNVKGVIIGLRMPTNA
ncbi:MAG: hypothetical protein OEY89_14960, partial [Gammaproteobacteria bacterium]|nr:hypothetical protein [Gammaproteobacteria bacterium]